MTTLPATDPLLEAIRRKRAEKNRAADPENDPLVAAIRQARETKIRAATRRATTAGAAPPANAGSVFPPHTFGYGLDLLTDNRVSGTLGAAGIGAVSAIPAGINLATMLVRGAMAARDNPAQAVVSGARSVYDIIQNPADVLMGLPTFSQQIEEGFRSEVPMLPPSPESVAVGSVLAPIGRSAKQIEAAMHRAAGPRASEPFTPESVAYSAGQSYSLFAPTLAAAAVSGPAAPAVLFGGALAIETAANIDQTYQTLKAQNPGMSDEEALNRAFFPALAAGIPAAALEVASGPEAAVAKAAAQRELGTMAGTLARRVLAGGRGVTQQTIEEVLTEPVQGTLSDLQAAAETGEPIDWERFLQGRGMEVLTAGVSAPVMSGPVQVVGVAQGPAPTARGGAQRPKTTAPKLTQRKPGAEPTVAPTAAPAKPPSEMTTDEIEALIQKAKANLAARSEQAKPKPTEGTPHIDALLGIKREEAKQEPPKDKEPPATITPPRGGSTLAELLRDDSIPATTRKGLTERYAAGEISREEYVAALEAQLAQTESEKFRREMAELAGIERGGKPAAATTGEGLGEPPQTSGRAAPEVPAATDSGRQPVVPSETPAEPEVVAPAPVSPESAPESVARFFAGRDDNEMRSVRNWIEEGAEPPAEYADLFRAAKDYPDAFAAELARRNIREPQQPGAVSAAPQPGAANAVQEEGQEGALSAAPQRQVRFGESTGDKRQPDDGGRVSEHPAVAGPRNAPQSTGLPVPVKPVEQMTRAELAAELGITGKGWTATALRPRVLEARKAAAEAANRPENNRAEIEAYREAHPDDPTIDAEPWRDEDDDFLTQYGVRWVRMTRAERQAIIDEDARQGRAEDEAAKRESDARNLAEWERRKAMERATDRLAERINAEIVEEIDGEKTGDSRLAKSRGGSWYGEVGDRKIRVSDHYGKTTGGFDEGTGETYGGADLNFVIDEGGNVEVLTPARRGEWREVWVGPESDLTPAKIRELLGLAERPASTTGAADVSLSPPLAGPGQPAPPVSTSPPTAPRAKEAPARVPAGEAPPVSTKEPWEMTREQFDNAGFYQHSILRKDAQEVGPEGFSFGIGPNAWPATSGPPMNIMDKRWGTRAGRSVYVVPAEAVVRSPIGPKIKEGWRPSYRITPRYDFQPLHEALIEWAVAAGKPVPPEVLADYPDLVAKAGTKVEPQEKAEAATPSAFDPERGLYLGEGDTPRTSSGRMTTPFPRTDTTSEARARNTLRRVDQWLIDNALAEAKSRKDDYNASLFGRMTPKNMSAADRAMLNEYLFGEQPPVEPGIKRDLGPLKSYTGRIGRYIIGPVEAVSGTRFGVFVRGEERKGPIADFSTSEEADRFMLAQHAAETTPAEISKEPDYRSDIPVAEANAAHRGTSMVPEERGRQIRDEYAAHLREFRTEIDKVAESPEQKARAEVEFARYRQGYRDKYLAWLRAKSRVMSTMITGPANFPVRRNEKRAQAERSRLDDLIEWSKRARSAVFRAIRDAATPEQRTSAETKRLVAAVIDFAATERGYREGKLPGIDISLFRSSLRTKLQRAAEAGEVEAVQEAVAKLRELQEKAGRQLFNKGNPIWSLGETAKKARAAQEALPTRPVVVSEYEGGIEVVRDYQDDRVRIEFRGKPPEAVRNDLKASGFRWSPANGAWQRMNTDASVAAANQVLGRHYKKSGPRAAEPSPEMAAAKPPATAASVGAGIEPETPTPVPPAAELPALLREKMALEKRARSAFYRRSGLRESDPARHAQLEEEEKSILARAEAMAAPIASIVEQAVGPYPGDIPSVARQQPPANTPAGKAVEDNWRAEDANISELWAQERDLDREIGEKKYGSKIRASLEAKREALRERVAEAEKRWTKARDAAYRQGQEEAYYGPDPWRKLGVLAQWYPNRWTEVSQYLTRVAEHIVERVAPELDAEARSKIAHDSVVAFMETPRSDALTARIDTQIYVHKKRTAQEEAKAKIEETSPLETRERDKAKRSIENADDPAEMQKVVEEYQEIARQRNEAEQEDEKARAEVLIKERAANTDALMNPAKMRTPTAKQVMGSTSTPAGAPVQSNGRMALFMDTLPAKVREQVEKLPVHEMTTKRGRHVLTADEIKAITQEMAAKADRPVTVLGTLLYEGDAVVMAAHGNGEVEAFDGKMFAFLRSLAPEGKWRTAGTGTPLVLFDGRKPVGMMMPRMGHRTPPIEFSRALYRAEHGWPASPFMPPTTPPTHRPTVNPEATGALDEAVFPTLSELGLDDKVSKLEAERDRAARAWSDAAVVLSEVERVLQENRPWRDKVDEIAKQMSGSDNPPAYFYGAATTKLLKLEPEHIKAAAALDRAAQARNKAQKDYEAALHRITTAWTPEIENRYRERIKDKKWWQLEAEKRRLEKSNPSDPRISVLLDMLERSSRAALESIGETTGEILPPDYKPGRGSGVVSFPRTDYTKPVGASAFGITPEELRERNRKRGPATWVAEIATGEPPSGEPPGLIRWGSPGYRAVDAIADIAKQVPEFRADPVFTVSDDGQSLLWSAGTIRYRIDNPWLTKSKRISVDEQGKEVLADVLEPPFEPGQTIRIDLDSFGKKKARGWYVVPKRDTVLAVDTPAGQKALTLLEKLDRMAREARNRIKARGIPRGRTTGATTLFDDTLDAAVIVAVQAAKAGIKAGRALTRLVSESIPRIVAEFPHLAGRLHVNSLRRAVLGLLRDADHKPDGLHKAYADARTALERRRTRGVGEAVGDARGVREAIVEAQAGQPEIRSRTARAVRQASKEARRAAMIAAADDADLRIRQAIAAERGKARRRAAITAFEERARREGEVQTERDKAGMASFEERTRRESEIQAERSKARSRAYITAFEERVRREGEVQALRDRARAVEDIKAQLVRDIQTNILRKESQAKFLKAIARTKTLAQLRRQNDRIRRVFARDAANEAWKSVRKNTKWRMGARIAGRRDRPGPMKLLYPDERTAVLKLRSEADAIRKRFNERGRPTADMLADAQRMLEVAREISETVEEAKQRTVEIGAAIRAKRDSLAAMAVEGIEKAAPLARAKGDPKEPRDPFENWASRVARGWSDLETNAELLEGPGGKVLRRVLYDALIEAENRQYQQIHDDQIAMDEAAKAAGFKGANDLMVQGTEIAGRALSRRVEATLAGQRFRLLLGELLDIAGHARDPKTRALIEAGVPWKFESQRSMEPIVPTVEEFDAIAREFERAAPGLLQAIQGIKNPRFLEAAAAKYELTGVYPEIEGENHWPRARDMAEAPQAGLPEIARGGIVRRFMEKAGFYESRVTDTRTPLLIRNGLLVLNEHLHDLAAATHMAKPARMAYGVLKHPDVVRAIKKAHGARVYRVIEESVAGATGLSDVAQDPTLASKVARVVNRNLATANLALNAKSMAVNAAGGLARASGLTGPELIAKGSANVGRVPAGRLESLSSYFWRRWNHGGFGRFSPVQEGVPRAESGASWADIWNAIERNARALDARGVWRAWEMVQEKAFAVYNATDRFVANTLFAGYLAQSREAHQDWTDERHDRWAAAQTERVFRKTQNPSSTADMSYNYMLARGRLISVLYLFSSDKFKAWTRLRQAAHQGTFRRAAAAELADLLLATLIRRGLPVALGMLGAALFGPGDDPEERKKRHLQELRAKDWQRWAAQIVSDATGVAAPSPIISNAVSLLLGLGEQDIAGTPATEAANRVARATRMLAEAIAKGDERRVRRVLLKLLEAVREIVGDPTVGAQRTLEPFLP